MVEFSVAQALIAAMITPALLILASGSLIATALVRLARIVDRVRKLAETLGTPFTLADLHRHQHRALLAERAVFLYFCAVVCFVAAGFAIGLDHALQHRLTWLPVATTILGMALIVAGSAVMLRECQLAATQIRAEISTLISDAAPPA